MQLTEMRRDYQFFRTTLHQHQAIADTDVTQEPQDEG